QQQQQQQQQQAAHPPKAQQEPSKSSAPTLSPIQASHPFNPTLYDDKAEVDDDGAPIYNGYRDTIFGAYSQPQGHEDDDDDENDARVPNVPSSTLATMAKNDASKQQTATSNENATEGGATGVQRKKSVKFTVPNSGPVIINNISDQHSSKENQTQPSVQNKVQAQAHSESEDEGDYEDEAEFEEDEDEDDIKLRLMEAEVPSPSSTNSRPPFINTTPGASPIVHHQNQSQNGLSPVHSPDQAYRSPRGQFQNQSNVPPPSHGGYISPPGLSTNVSPSLGASSPLGDDFYEDVLAAVDKNAKTLPSATVQTSSQPNQSYQYVQQQHIPPPQSQHLQAIHVEREVFGAPSPRMKPAAASNQQNNYTSPPPPPLPQLQTSVPSSPKPVLSPRSAARPTVTQRQQDFSDDEEEFYDTSIL
ncbi:hypothetical protein BGX27_001929, partial [Mortierella sp. AM989]